MRTAKEELKELCAYMIRKKFYVPKNEVCRDYNNHMDRKPVEVVEELKEDNGSQGSV